MSELPIKLYKCTTCHNKNQELKLGRRKARYIAVSMALAILATIGIIECFVQNHTGAGVAGTVLAAGAFFIFYASNERIGMRCQYKHCDGECIPYPRSQS